MVTYKLILSILRKLELSFDIHKNGDRTVVTVCDRGKTMFIDLAFSKNTLTELYFLNNQFYEVDEADLLQCFEDIIYGKYAVKRTLFGKKWIRTLTGNLSPTRTIDKGYDFKIYDTLPSQFTA